MEILLNLLAVTTGGQVTRAEAFLRRVRAYAPNARLMIVKDRNLLPFIDNSADWDVVNVTVGVGRLRALRRTLWENLVLPRLMRAECLDIYLTFSHYLPIFLGKTIYSIVGVSNLAPFSTEAWNVESNAVRLKMKFLKYTIISSAKRANQVIALSQTCRDLLVGYGIEESKITVVPNGVEIYQGLQVHLPISKIFGKKSYVLSVSHFYRYKNYEKLIKAFSMLPVNCRKDLSLIIVGRPYDYKYYEKICGLIEDLALSDHIRVIPGMDRSELDALYRTASLFVFTSLIENSPNILLEAMAYGLPVISSNAEPMPEFGADAICYYEAMSAEDLASKMIDILSDNVKSTYFRSKAKKRADNYSWDSFTKSVVNICNKSQR